MKITFGFWGKNLIGIIFFLASYALHAQLAFQPQKYPLKNFKSTTEHFKVRTSSYGMIIGLQRGSFTFLEFGAEKHWKKVKLAKPRTYSLGGNFEYNFKNNVLGYKVSGWTKIGRINLTYGVNLCYFTDFEAYRLGIGPALGFRLLGFHLINGYNFTFGSENFEEYNKLYVTLRYFFPLDTKIGFRKSNN